MDIENRIFRGLFPGGIVWADKKRERGGDYARLAFLHYDTLEPRIEQDCPKILRPIIEAEIKAYQARRGEMLQTSACGSSVRLGGPEATRP